MAAEWRKIRLGDLVAQGRLAIGDGYRVRNLELGPEGIPFVRGGDIGDGWINTDTSDHIRPELAERVRHKLTRAGDVAFITKGTVGRAGRLRPGQPAVVFAPQVAYWRVLSPDTLDSGFLFYFIRSHQFQSALDGVKTHGSMVADYVSISQQYDFEFRFPDIESQRAIARILGSLDDKIDLNRRKSDTLESMAQALFKSWFVDFDPVRAKAEARNPGWQQHVAELFPDAIADSELGKTPSGWPVRRLGELIRVIKGRSYKSSELIESDTALVTLKSFERGGGYRADGLKSFAGKFKSEQVIEPGEVVIACTDVTQSADVIGRPAVVWPDTRYSTLVASLDTVIVRPKDDRITRAFLYLLCRTVRFTEHTYAHTTGTTVLHLAKEAIPSFRLALAPENLVNAFDRIAAPTIARVQKSALEIKCLAALRDTLLPKLVSGELRVKDAERAVEAAV